VTVPTWKTIPDSTRGNRVWHLFVQELTDQGKDQVLGVFVVSTLRSFLQHIDKKASIRSYSNPKDSPLSEASSEIVLYSNRLFDRADLTKPISNVRLCVHMYVRRSTKRFFDFNDIWHVCRGR